MTNQQNPVVIAHVESLPTPLGPLLSGVQMDKSYFTSPASMVMHTLFHPLAVPIPKEYLGSYARSMVFMPGATFGNAVGPNPTCDVMVIGRLPPVVKISKFQTARSAIRDLLGDSASVLEAAFEATGITDHAYKHFYATNMIRFPDPRVKRSGQLPKWWTNEGLHLLYQEIAIIRPRVILCLGREATKLFTGTTMKRATGVTYPFELEVAHMETIKATVVCAPLATSVIDNFESKPEFLAAMNLFAEVYSGVTHEPFKFDFTDATNEEQLEAKVTELIDAGITDFAVDCEWGGEHFMTGKLRTIQVSWSGTEALNVILNGQMMKSVYQPDSLSAAKLLRRLFYRPGVKIVGHNIMDDAIWLKDFGVDIINHLFFDTMLAHHLLFPTEVHKLENVACTYIPGWVRHDTELDQYIIKNPLTEGKGYAEIPNEILHPYGCKDTCSTFLLWKKFEEMLGEPGRAKLRWLHRLEVEALEPLIEIQMTGMPMDRDRLMSLRDQYVVLRDRLVAKFRDMIGDSTFNVNSSAQKVKLLFHDLGLSPVKTTGTYPKMWEHVVERGEENKYDPSVDGETLEILGHKNEAIKVLRDACVIGTVVKSFLQEDSLDPVSGLMTPKGGLIGYLQSDSRLYTEVGQMLKTGRLSTRNPNISNMPGRQSTAALDIFNADPDFKDLVPSIRTAFKADRGELLIASDYKQAEVATLAYLSGDEGLIAAVEDPNGDIHSYACMKMFNLTCTMAEVKDLHYALRISAKSIIFGLLYGRGAAAIAREVQKAGVDCTTEQAKSFMDSFMQQFPKIDDLMTVIRDLAMSQGFVETEWGRRAYYYNVEASDNESIIQRQKRQAFNFIIQGFVGDLLRRALVNLKNYRKEHDDVDFKIGMTVYDSITLCTPTWCAEKVADIVMPLCMAETAMSPGVKFKIGIDTDVFQRWEEKMEPKALMDLGMSEDFARRYGKSIAN